MYMQTFRLSLFILCTEDCANSWHSELHSNQLTQQTSDATVLLHCHLSSYLPLATGETISNFKKLYFHFIAPSSPWTLNLKILEGEWIEILHCFKIYFQIIYKQTHGAYGDRSRELKLEMSLSGSLCDTVLYPVHTAVTFGIIAVTEHSTNSNSCPVVIRHCLV